MRRVPAPRGSGRKDPPAPSSHFPGGSRGTPFRTQGPGFCLYSIATLQNSERRRMLGWTAPDGISCARLQVCNHSQGSRPMTIIRIGLDTSKRVFELHGVDERAATVLRRQLPRGQVVKFFQKLPATRIGPEACGAAHSWARVLRGLGHAPVLLPPQYIKPWSCPRRRPGSSAARTMRSIPCGPSAHGLDPWGSARR
jgi:hypothetical protein